MRYYEPFSNDHDTCDEFAADEENDTGFLEALPVGEDHADIFGHYITSFEALSGMMGIIGGHHGTHEGGVDNSGSSHGSGDDSSVPELVPVVSDDDSIMSSGDFARGILYGYSDDNAIHPLVASTDNMDNMDDDATTDEDSMYADMPALIPRRDAYPYDSDDYDSDDDDCAFDPPPQTHDSTVQKLIDINWSNHRHDFEPLDLTKTPPRKHFRANTYMAVLSEMNNEDDGNMDDDEVPLLVQVPHGIVSWAQVLSE